MDLSRLDGKVAVVTGSSQGIGLAAARRLGQLGARIVVNSRSEERAKQTAAALESEGLSSTGIGADISTDSGVKTLFEHALAACDTIDILVNNAGTTVVKPSEDLARRTPTGRIATLEEIANAIAFLVSPAASFINATTLLVDGGWTAYGGW